MDLPRVQGPRQLAHQVPRDLERADSPRREGLSEEGSEIARGGERGGTEKQREDVDARATPASRVQSAKFLVVARQGWCPLLMRA